jgi:hypothetical protein
VLNILVQDRRDANPDFSYRVAPEA